VQCSVSSGGKSLIVVSLWQERDVDIDLVVDDVDYDAMKARNSSKKVGSAKCPLLLTTHSASFLPSLFVCLAA
jgi:hypothetical protein